MQQSVALGARGRVVYLAHADKDKADAWVAQGFTEALKHEKALCVETKTEEEARELLAIFSKDEI